MSDHFHTMIRSCPLFLGCAAGALILVTHPSNADDTFASRRATLVARYDTNGDGKLDAEERETMRLETKEQRLKGGGLPADLLADYDENKDGDMDDREWGRAVIAEQLILTAKYDSDRDGSLSDPEQRAMMVDVRSVPMRYARDYCAYLIVYDKNKNGQFDNGEYAQAQAAESKVVMAAYDADGDGKLSPTEKGRGQADMKRGVIVGFYLRFASVTLDGGDKGASPRGGGDDYLTEQKRLLAFDADGDGLASSDELEVIRAARGSTP